MKISWIIVAMSFSLVMGPLYSDPGPGKVDGSKPDVPVASPAAKQEPVLIKTHEEAVRALGKKVRIIGRAVNTKLSARVESKFLGLQCIEKECWEPSILKKEVEVTGILEMDVLPDTTHDENGFLTQGSKGGQILVLTKIQYWAR